MACMQKRGGRHSQAGFGLIVTLWGVTFLFVLVLILSSSVQIETRTTIYRKEAAQAYALACGGVEAALAEIAYPRGEDDPPSPLWSWQQGQRQGTVPLESGTAELTIVNATGLLDLNVASEDQLTRLLVARGVEPAEAQALAAGIVAWRKPPRDDSDVATDQARRGPFVTVEEVLRVPGMTREIFYGTVEVTEEGEIKPRYGVGQDLTVRSRTSTFNINYASETALRSVPGIQPGMARALVEERAEEPFETISEVSQRLSFSLPAEALPFLNTAVTDTYSITSAGQVEGSGVRRTVRAVVQLAAQGEPRYRILNWYDDYVAE